MGTHELAAWLNWSDVQVLEIEISMRDGASEPQTVKGILSLYVMVLVEFAPHSWTWS